MKRALQVVAGLAVSAVALWLTLRGKDLGAIWVEMRDADYRYLAPYVLVLLAIHVVKTVRWSTKPPVPCAPPVHIGLP